MKKELINQLTENDLIKKIQSEDNNLAKEELIRRNINFIYKLSHKYYNKFLSFEDIVQEALIGYLEAIKKFDLSRGIKFNTFAYYYVTKRLSLAMWLARDGGIHMANYTYMDRIKIWKLDSDLFLNMNETCFMIPDSGTFDNLFGDAVRSNLEIDTLSRELTIEKLYSYLTEEEQSFMDKKFGLHGCKKFIGWELCDFYDRSDTHLQTYYQNIIDKLKNISTAEGLDKF